MAGTLVRGVGVQRHGLIRIWLGGVGVQRHGLTLI